ncbi:MAG: A/G-specific adenine glycosylase [Chlamydiales bacterium]|nr:A/G-specific adenine glycosylase [Chlamydiales bacterium]
MNTDSLKEWFVNQRRQLPWRSDASPYAVWVSEVMLQQTQVAVVIPYFLRWMERFPTVQNLANASADEVIKLWEGLGYYSRARNLHAGAQYVVEKFGGVLPAESHELSQIKGLGPYTVAAIQAFAFKQKTAAVDGNVLRVISRLYAIHEPINQPKTVSKIRAMAQEMLPDQEPWLVAEALIELGATICSRKPVCEMCPMQPGCKSYAQGIQEQLPKKDKQVVAQKLFRAVAVIKSTFGLLLRRCVEGEIMNDLHEFPYFEVTESGIDHTHLLREFPLSLEFEHSMPSVSHSFTRYRVRLDPVIFTCFEAVDVAGYQWKAWDEIPSLAFSSGHRRILQAIMKQED